MLKKIISFTLLYAMLTLLAAAGLVLIFDINPVDADLGWLEGGSIAGVLIAAAIVLGGPAFAFFGTFSKKEASIYTIIGIILLLVLGGLGYIWLFKPLLVLLTSKTLWGLVVMLVVTLVAWFWPGPRHSYS